MRREEVLAEPMVIWVNPPLEGSTRDGVVESDGVVAIDEMCSNVPEEHRVEAVIALAANLVDQGVAGIETRYVVAVNRVVQMHRAISAGTTKAISP